jgi:hypothetical protein
MFQLFDYNDASMLNGNRDTSTVAPQALFLMNSSFMQQATRNLAQELQALESFQQRITSLYQRLYARSPTATESERCQRYLEVFRQAPPLQAASSEDKQPPPTTPELRAWQALCHVLVMSNEFIYVK